MDLKWLSSDASKELGYASQRLKLSPIEQVSVKKSPDGLTAPLYGEFKIGLREYALKGHVKFTDKALPAILPDEMATGDFRGKDGGQFSGVLLVVDINADDAIPAECEHIASQPRSALTSSHVSAFAQRPGRRRQP